MKKYLNTAKQFYLVKKPLAFGAGLGLLALSTSSYAAIDVSDAVGLLTDAVTAIGLLASGVFIVVGTIYGLRKAVAFIKS